MLIFKQGSRIFRLVTGVFLLSSAYVVADERILDYHSDIKIQVDGSLIVTETIQVRAEGNNIRRGIYRDFPTRYVDRFGNYYNINFKVLDVGRNGAPEPYHTENRNNGVRVYIGSSNRMIDNGVHTYRLRFTTNRQLGFFEDFDELYWNVTGNGWVFPIDHASARIELPAAVLPGDLRIDFYTGAQGDNGKRARSSITGERSIEFETTRGLPPFDGLTVAVGWPKGVVQQPTTSQQIGFFLQDNGSALLLLFGLLVPLAWYFRAWHLHGRDPQKGVIIPRYKPPVGLTPAGCSYILNMSFRKQAFSAAVINLGVKGYLDIREDDDDFTLHRKSASGNGKASKGERAVMDELFQEAAYVELDNKNHRVFGKAQSELRKALKAEHLGRLFNLNVVYALPAVGVTIIAIIVAAQLAGGPVVWIIFVILSLIMHLSFLFLLRAATPAGRRVMDEIEGFKMYLDTAEQDRLDRMRSPQLTPEVFETFLPFAFALGVENRWCNRFALEFPEDPGKQGGYNPAWYAGNRRGFAALGHLGSDFGGSFSSAISSASSPPGSSSGSGGGGSSGGGGGGGGGGGW